MVSAVRQVRHLSVLPGGNRTPVDTRAHRARRRYDRLTRTAFHRGERVRLPGIGPVDGGAA